MNAPRPLDKIKTLSISSPQGQVTVEADTGIIRTLAVKRGRKLVDLMAQTRQNQLGYIGGLRIYDELDGQWYDDWHSKPRVTKATKRGNTITITKRYPKAPFEVTLTLTLNGAELAWDVVCTQKAKVNRQLRVIFQLPIIAGWKCWTTSDTHDENSYQGPNQPWGFDGMTSFDFYYNQTPYVGTHDLIVPIFSMYDPGEDVGLSFAEHLDRNVPGSIFRFSNGEREFDWGFQEKPDISRYPHLEVVHPYIGMRGTDPCTTGGLIFLHQGHWRPGLGLYYTRFKKWFDPACKDIYDREGTFECGSVHVADRIKDFKSIGGKYLEVHGHFPWYGNYFPTEDEWYTIDHLEREYVPEHRRPKTYRKLSQELIHANLKKLTDAGVSNHWYFNYTDGYRPEVDPRFADSFVMKENGEVGPSGWRLCHCMLADPALSFGKYIIETAKKVIARYGDVLDGFFLDCFRHFELDFGHDDGVTMVNNKPAYSVNHMFTRIQEQIGKLLQKRNMDCFANKPRTMATMRHVDGVLLEGSGDAAEVKWYFSCIAMPLFYMWTANYKPQEEYLKRAVVLGGWPRDPVLSATDPAEKKREFRRWAKLYQKYTPLYPHFTRRVFCFEPDPIGFSDGIYGQVYTRPDGAYVAGVMADWVSVDDKIRRVKAPFVQLRLKNAAKIGKVQVHYAGQPSPVDVTPKLTGKELVVELPDLVSAAAIICLPGKGGLKALTAAAVEDKVETLGDPTVGYEMGSGAKEK